MRVALSSKNYNFTGSIILLSLRQIWRTPVSTILIVFLAAVAAQVAAHSGGLNKHGCHAGSRPYHCHNDKPNASKNENTNINTLHGTVTNLQDGDTTEVNDIAIRLLALNYPENGAQKGDYATEVAKQFTGLKAASGIKGAKTYDRLVGYCEINGSGFGK